MTGKLHLIVKDGDGNVQNIFVPCAMESQGDLCTLGGVMLAKTLEGIAVDVTSLAKPEQVMQHVMANVIGQHGPECRAARNTSSGDADSYNVYAKLDDEARELTITHLDRTIGHLPIKYCPFCGARL